MARSKANPSRRNGTMAPDDATFEVLRQSIAACISRWTVDTEQFDTAIPGLTLYRHDAPTQPTSCMVGPSIAVTVQGTKRALLGDDHYTYHSGRFLITALDLPVVLQAIEASRERPYLSLVLKLDERLLAELVMQGDLPPPPAEPPVARGMVLGDTSTALFEALLRLVRLLDEPDAARVLAPLVQREVFYRLLTGGQGAFLWQMVSVGSQSHRVARAIAWLKQHAAEPLRIKQLAQHVQMSPSRFHHHFRTLTAMSPLQFQKWLRLNEARRLMLAERLDASSAAFQVGYESPSQFSREYSRLFGAPPRRDVEGLRMLPTHPRDQAGRSAA